MEFVVYNISCIFRFGRIINEYRIYTHTYGLQKYTVDA